LGGISKRGDSYVRTLLIHGARSVVRVETSQRTPTHCGAINLVERRNKNIAAVVLANKNARIIWALLTQNREYQSDFVSIA
jgi:transposase